MTKKHAVHKVEKKLAADEKRLKTDVEIFEIDEEEFEEMKEDVVKLVKVFRQTGLRDFVRYLNSPWRIVVNNFFGGIFRGLGIIIGMTLVFAVLIWFLGKFVNFPLIGEYFLDLKMLLETFAPANGYR